MCIFFLLILHKEIIFTKKNYTKKNINMYFNILIYYYIKNI